MPYTQDDRLRPFTENPFYWQYRGKPVLLLGGSVQDSLFQIDAVEEHLDALVACGGNFVRCSLSCRTPGSVFPFVKNGELFNLDQWNPAYHQRLDSFLRLTHQRQIFVQVEYWDSWDYYKIENTWDTHPFNPKNNTSYTAESSGLPETVNYFPFEKIQPFFETPPGLHDLALARKYQEALFDHHVEILLNYDHVLHCISNETNADPQWGFYWNNRLRTKAREKGVEVETTEMFDNWDPSNGLVPGALIQSKQDHPFLDRANALVTIDNPDCYSFVDISNHNAQRGQVHYETALFVRNRIRESARPRPFGCDKMYGGPLNSSFSSNSEEGMQRWWRNVFAGMAAVRFHRPPAGLGLSEHAQKHICGMRMLTDAFDVFSSEPRNDLLFDNVENCAFCLACKARAYAVCFLNGGRVHLNCAELNRSTIRWLDIGTSRWLSPLPLEHGTERLELVCPDKGFWAVLVM